MKEIQTEKFTTKSAEEVEGKQRKQKQNQKKFYHEGHERAILKARLE